MIKVHGIPSVFVRENPCPISFSLRPLRLSGFLRVRPKDRDSHIPSLTMTAGSKGRERASPADFIPQSTIRPPSETQKSVLA
jgi:hypothetical protein